MIFPINSINGSLAKVLPLDPGACSGSKSVTAAVE